MRLLAFAVLAISPAIAAAPIPDAAAQNQQLEQLRAFMSAHRNADALALAEKIIAETEESLTNEKRVIFSGQSLETTLLDMGSAAAIKKEAVDVGAPYGFALFSKGYVLAELGRENEGGAYLDHAVAVSPFEAQFLCEDGFWHAHHGDTTGALDLYKRCESYSGLAHESLRKRWKAAGLRGQGFALIDLGKLDEAESRYRESLKLEPDNPHALNDLKYIQQQRAKASKSAT